MNIIEDLRTLLSPRALILHNAYVHLLNRGEVKDHAKLAHVKSELPKVLDWNEFIIHETILFLMDSEPKPEIVIGTARFQPEYPTEYQYLRVKNVKVIIPKSTFSELLKVGVPIEVKGTE